LPALGFDPLPLMKMGIAPSCVLPLGVPVCRMSVPSP